MSRPELPVILSPQAEMDLTEVLQYTLETWGDVQMRAYAAVLDKALLNLRTNPQIGHPRPELSAEHKIFPAGPAHYCVPGNGHRHLRLPCPA